MWSSVSTSSTTGLQEDAELDVAVLVGDDVGVDVAVRVGDDVGADVVVPVDDGVEFDPALELSRHPAVSETPTVARSDRRFMIE